MLGPLAGCALTGPFLPVAGGFDKTIASLSYQARVLGIRVIHAPPPPVGAMLDYQLEVPGLDPITFSIHGWSSDDTQVASEQTVQAAVGLMSVHGRGSGQAQALGVDYVSTLAASLALTGAFATALGRLRGADISRCHVSLAAAGLVGVGQYLAGATVAQDAEQLLPGCISAVLRPPFQSADGVVFELETLDADPWRAFWGEIEVPPEDVAKGWRGFLMRYAKAVSPIPASLCDALAKMAYVEIVERCRHSGVSICPVRPLAQRLDDGSLKQGLEQGPWAFTWSCATAPSRPCKGDLPLDGLSVVESCRRIQGPLAGHLLSFLGAEVVRLELPGGDPLRGMAPLADGCSVRFDALNSHKQVVEVDIKSAEGRAEVLQHVSDADVFLHNWAPGKASELNLDQADLASVNPALIYAYAGGWGREAVPEGMPGTDFMVQAWSGVAEQIARAGAMAGGSLFTVLDVLGGVIAAQGITAALLVRQLTGQAGRMDSSLLG
ncbi:MAG: CoA transferase, partial [Pseudomonas gingeri]